MSTANFSRPNLNYNYTLENDDDYNYIIDAISEDLDKIKVGHVSGYSHHNQWIGDELAFYTFDFSIYDHEYKEWIDYTIPVTIENGYYTGVQIDIYLGDFPDYDELNKTNKNLFDRLINKIESVLSLHTTKYIRVATFSNGEAIYQKI